VQRFFPFLERSLAVNPKLSARPGNRISRFQPAMETLEDRWCPSASSITLQGQHTLVIHTTHAADAITITDNGQGGVSATVTGGDTLSGGGASVTGVVVIADAGNDSISYAATGQVTVNHNIRLNLKGSHDQVSFNFNDGINTDMFGLQILNHGGSDSVAASFGNIVDTVLNFSSNSPAGKDQVVVNLNGNINGVSNATFNLLGNKGNNVFVVNAPHTNVDVSSTVTINMMGTSGNDTLVTSLEGTVDGTLNVTSAGNHGTDAIVTNLTFDSGSNGTVAARVRDDGASGGHDSLTLNVNNTSPGVALTKLTARIVTHHGDVISNTPNVNVTLV
jgi:hypothetical protein